MDKVRKHTDLSVKDGLVVVALEDSGEPFSISRALLLSASEYFRKALSNGFAETSEQTLRLPGCYEQTFRLFLYYMTTNTLPAFDADYVVFDKGEHTVDELIALGAQFQVALVRIWLFGDMYLMPKLQNTAMDRLLDLLKWTCVTLDAAQLAFATDPDSLLCNAFVTVSACDYINTDSTPNLRKYTLYHLGLVAGWSRRFMDAIVYYRDRDYECKHKTNFAPSKTQDRKQFYMAEL